MNPWSMFELARDLVAARMGCGHPLYLVHALTARCNARCGFCAWNPEFYDARDQLADGRDQAPLRRRARRRVRRASRSGAASHSSTRTSKRSCAHAHDARARHAPRDERVPARAQARRGRARTSIAYASRSITLRDCTTSCAGIRGLFDKIVSSTRALKARAPSKPIVFVCTLQKANVAPQTIRDLAELMKELGVLGIFNGLREEAATDGDAGTSTRTRRPRPSSRSRSPRCAS